MKTLVVGDLHGNLEIAKHAIKQRTTDKVVFMGDYLDSFNRSSEDQVWTLGHILNAVEEDPERFQGLIGNHEISYTVDRQKCSGWSEKTQVIVTHLKEKIDRLLKKHLYVGDYLLTHAGVCQGLLDSRGVTLEEYLKIGDYLQIGKRRGGLDDYGGLFWCDWNTEFKPLDGVKQVVGHTHYRYTGQFKEMGGAQNTSINIDCLPQMNRIRIELGDVAMGLIIDEETGISSEVNILEL